jgi:hypothetical protein
MEQDNSFVHSTLDDGEDIYITDQWKRKYHFKMASFTAPTGLAFEAIEVKDDNLVPTFPITLKKLYKF